MVVKPNYCFLCEKFILTEKGDLQLNICVAALEFLGMSSTEETTSYFTAFSSELSKPKRMLSLKLYMEKFILTEAGDQLLFICAWLHFHFWSKFQGRWSTGKTIPCFNACFLLSCKSIHNIYEIIVLQTQTISDDFYFLVEVTTISHKPARKRKATLIIHLLQNMQVKTAYIITNYWSHILVWIDSILYKIMTGNNYFLY